MLTAEGCRQRRIRLWERLDPKPDTDYLLLSDPRHLVYLANFHVDPFNLGHQFGGLLLVRNDGNAKLIHDNRLPKSVEQAHVEETRKVMWYDGQSPGHGPRQLALLETVNPAGHGLRIHDRPGDKYANTLIRTLTEMRRQKDPDEIAVLRQCMKLGDVGHAWARENVQPGMTELDVYCGISNTCTQAAGQPVVLYGDFSVCGGPNQRGGMATSRVLKNGDMLILDFSVVLHGYRSDFTNTLCVGGQVTLEQIKWFQLCCEAMKAGELKLRAGIECLEVYQAVRDVFEQENMAENFPHHAGHGLGLSHPEDPYIVRNATQTLMAGDVVTLEPGLYFEGKGGLRIEHNYLIKENGCETLSGHSISFT